MGFFFKLLWILICGDYIIDLGFANSEYLWNPIISLLFSTGVTRSCRSCLKKVLPKIRWLSMNEFYGNASASSGSSWNSSSNDTEDDHAIATILAEEERLKHDGKLGKKLSHFGSIPHIPRVIGGIPDANDATLDHEMLSKGSLDKSISMLRMDPPLEVLRIREKKTNYP